MYTLEQCFGNFLMERENQGALFHSLFRVETFTLCEGLFKVKEI